MDEVGEIEGLGPAMLALNERRRLNSCFQPLINHPSDHTIRDSLVKKVSKVGV